MLPSHSGVLAEAINTKTLTKNHPDSPHSHAEFLHSHPDSPHSHLDSPRSHPGSPRSHPDSLHSHHSPHSVPRFPIPTFTDSQCQLPRQLKLRLGLIYEFLLFCCFNIGFLFGGFSVSVLQICDPVAMWLFIMTLIYCIFFTVKMTMKIMKNI